MFLFSGRFLENPIEFLEVQKILNPFLVKGLDPDVESLGEEFFVGYAEENDLDLLLGIDSNFLLNAKVEEMYQRMRKYIYAGLDQKRRFTLLFNDIPADMSRKKLKKIFSMVREIREGKTS